MKQELSLWLPYDLDTNEKIKKELLLMIESTIERHLKPTKTKRQRENQQQLHQKLSLKYH